MGQPALVMNVHSLRAARWNRAVAKWDKRSLPARALAEELLRALKDLHASPRARQAVERAVERALCSAMIRSGALDEARGVPDA